MPHVLIVNPSARKKASKSTSTRKARKGKATMAKQRTAAQKAATRKMIAANRARRKPARKAAPRRAKRRAAPVASAARRSSPKRRKARRSVTSAPVASRAGRQLRYRRRNPVGGIGDFVQSTLMPSVIGGGGALALDVLLGVLPLPDAIKTGPMAPVAKVAGAVGLGILAGFVTSKRTAQQIAAGALTVTLYNVAKAGLVKMTGGKIPGLSSYDPESVGEYVGEYVDGSVMPALGYVDSGMQVDEYDESMQGYETGVYR